MTDKLPPIRRPRVEIPKRKKKSKKQREAFFLLHGGICHICGEPIEGRWEESHLSDLEISGDDSDENKRPAHYKCHRAYTYEVGNPTIARVLKQEKKDLGIFRPAKKKIANRPFEPGHRPMQSRGWDKR